MYEKNSCIGCNFKCYETNNCLFGINNEGQNFEISKSIDGKAIVKLEGYYIYVNDLKYLVRTPKQIVAQFVPEFEFKVYNIKETLLTEEN